ncbi:MAG TPA: hypothetical protein VFD36_25530 [Kofleriaceae bacterium]|nr:hypothetical protein [Kofleriaceae bacterium]
MRRAFVVAAMFAIAAAGCTGDLDPPWQLDHDRIIAVRATPPGVAAGESATLDALLGHKGAPTRVAPPELATVVSPASLADVLRLDGANWVVTAPGEQRLAQVRAELMLAPDAPVKLTVGVSYQAQALFATKVIELGRAATNPSLVSMNMKIDGAPAGSAEIVVQPLVAVPLSIDADDAHYDVTWLTSCGTMHDFDLPNAYLKVEAEDPTSGELAVVLRDGGAGVAWNVWPIRAE